VRWLVANTGNWLTGRKVLVHPSAIGHSDYGRNAKLVFDARLQVDAHSNGLYRHPKHRRSLRKPRKLSSI
jgi:hypothetical protein